MLNSTTMVNVGGGILNTISLQLMPIGKRIVLVGKTLEVVQDRVMVVLVLTRNASSINIMALWLNAEYTGERHSCTAIS